MILLITVGSCNQIDNKKTDSKYIERNHFDNSQMLLSFLNEFTDRDTTMTNNNETIKINSKILKKDLVELLKNNDSIFYQYPIKLEKVTKIDGEYYGKFFGVNSFWVNDISYEDSKKPISKGSNKIENLSYVFMIKLQKDEISTLKEGSYYKMVGKFKSILSDCQFKNLHLNSDDCNPIIEKGIHSPYLIRFDLGFMYFESTTKLELTEPNNRYINYSTSL